MLDTTAKQMIEIQAYKMDGLGNDFIIIDRRKDKIDLSKQQIINIADRKNGVRILPMRIKRIFVAK